MTSPEITEEAFAKMQAENERLKAEIADRGHLHLKVSQKGAVSVYGLGRFPVTLYAHQWRRLLDFKEELLEFIAGHSGEIQSKDA